MSVPHDSLAVSVENHWFKLLNFNSHSEERSLMMRKYCYSAEDFF